jgi:hypothetical protein
MPKFTHPDPNDEWQMRLYRARSAGGITQSQYNALAKNNSEPTGSSNPKVTTSLNSLRTWESAQPKEEAPTNTTPTPASSTGMGSATSTAPTGTPLIRPNP